MTLHLTPVVAKDGAGTSIPGGIQQNDTSGTGAGPNDPVAVLIDSTQTEVLGTVTASPTANTVLGRLKDLLSLIVLAAGSNIIGKVGIDQTTPGTTNLVATTVKSVLWNTGTSNNGLIASLLTLQSTELNALTNTSIAVSSVGGTSGVFTNSNTGAAIYGELALTLGAIGSALSAGANIAGWFIRSLDGGSTFEQSSAAPPRAPDFVIPLPATTISAAAQFASGTIQVPSVQFKVLLQNNTGQTLAATANTLKLAPIAQLD